MLTDSTRLESRAGVGGLHKPPVHGARQCVRASAWWWERHGGGVGGAMVMQKVRSLGPSDGTSGDPSEGSSVEQSDRTLGRDTASSDGTVRVRHTGGRQRRAAAAAGGRRTRLGSARVPSMLVGSLGRCLKDCARTAVRTAPSAKRGGRGEGRAADTVEHARQNERIADWRAHRRARR